MAGTAGPGYIVNWQGWALIAVAILFCALCVGLSSAYPGVSPLAFAGLAFAGGFLVSMAAIAGLKTGH